MSRLVIDTNLLVAAAYNPKSASQRILNSIESGEFTMIVSPDIVREYESVLRQAVRMEAGRVRVWKAIQQHESVTPVEAPRVTEDPSDDKFLAAAVAARADAIISSDKHLLDVHPHEGIPILRPTQFWDLQRGG